jgi:hypothetical protein
MEKKCVNCIWAYDRHFYSVERFKVLICEKREHRDDEGVVEEDFSCDKFEQAN